MDANDDFRVRTRSFLPHYLLITMVPSPVRIIPRSADLYFMQKLMKDLKEHTSAWAFLAPVNGEEVTDYYDFIKEPMGALRLSLCIPTPLTNTLFCRFPDNGRKAGGESVQIGRGVCGRRTAGV